MDYTSRLAWIEELKSMPFEAVWDKYCLECGVPCGISWLKEVKEYTLVKEDRPVEVYLGGTVNFALGVQNRIKFDVPSYTTKYNGDVDLMGGSTYLGAAYKLGKNFTAGLEAGVLFHNRDKVGGKSDDEKIQVTIPVSGVFKYYYGEPKVTHPYRFYNYAQVGPQFFLHRDSKTIGMLAGAGGGIRFVMGDGFRLEMQVGYQMNMRRVKPYDTGAYDVPASNIDFKEYVHIAQFGINIYLF
jgi:hypothetical protein